MPSKTKLIKPKTKPGKRALEKRAPKQVEDAKRALFLYGSHTSQNIKDTIGDLHKLKGIDSLKYTRKNEEAKPFEVGGEIRLESYCQRSNCSLFALGSHSKKRPDNIILGRLFDFRLYDMIEFGVYNFQKISTFPAHTIAQYGNKPSFVFVGEAFENDDEMKQVKSLMLDFFRGQQVDAVNLKGLDRVIYVSYTTDTTPRKILFRQYAVKFKKSGTRVPKTELHEMGPHMDLIIRRSRQPPVDLEKEALKQPKLTKTKQKNVGTDMLDGKVGRMYMPKQDVDSMALHKMKGLKRERRQAAENASAEKRPRREQSGDDGDASDSE